MLNGCVIWPRLIGLFVLVLLFSPFAGAATCSVCGTWQLLSATEVSIPAGQITQPYGAHPKGYLMYQPDGYMSVIIVNPERQKEANIPSAKQADMQLFSAMMSYAGTYTVTDTQIIHHIQMAWKPSWVGTDKVRDYTLQGDKLTLTMRENAPQGAYRATLIWKKMPNYIEADAMIENHGRGDKQN